MRILVIEDEVRLYEALVQILKKHNYTVDSDTDGESGLDDALSGIYDVVVLDIMLPKIDGITILKKIRSEGIDVPVILLTDKDSIHDKVTGLDSGADDYLILSIGLAFLISLYIANRSIKPIEESYNRQKRFVADASHELRTPLATINANADLLLSHPDSTIAEEKKWIIYIKDETERMTGLTNDLLYLAKSDADREEKVSSAVSISDITESTILETEAAAFEKGLELTYSVEPNIRMIASQDRLKQLILILIDNALKYTPKKGTIHVSLSKEGSKAVMRVENSGDGIAPDELPHIFDRFYRTDKSRARESGGSGLGLSIAKSICKSINADIRADSIPGKTTVFTVSFPALK